MNEPTVLDYIKAKIMPWRYSLPDIENEMVIQENINQPDLLSEEINQPEFLSVSERQPKFNKELVGVKAGPLRLAFALVLAIIAQIFLDNPANQEISIAFILYSISGGLLIWAILSGEWKIEFNNPEEGKFLPFNFDKPRLILMLVGLLLVVFSFFAFKGNQFTFFNVFLWILTLACFVFALFEKQTSVIKSEKLKQLLKNKKIDITITPWFFIVLLVFLTVFFFRFYRLDSVLGEMFSDHAEKLLDVNDVLQGDTKLYFIRNTGREFIQFYLTALVSVVFGSGLSFLSLKIGTALAGFFALPYIYALGKELANKRVAILAVFFTGISYWANLISRVGLRFPLYPLFVAPVLFYVIRGLRQKRRNDFIYAGIALGLSLHGYSSTRFLPFVVVFAFLLYILHTWQQKNKQLVLFGFMSLVLVSIVLFIPIFSYFVEDPGLVIGRSLSRLGTTERSYLEPPLILFFKNLKDALLMPFLNNGSTWVHSIPLRPALDIISAALYFLGSIYVLVRYLKQRHWEDLFLLLSVPLLMMPSILSLAFPEENPSLNRTSGAIIPVFIFVAIGMDGIFSNLWRRSTSALGRIVLIGFVGCLLVFSALLNYDLVFNQFNKNYMRNAWNTSQIGEVIHGWSVSTGNKDRAYVVPYPHWVDTRLVGINAGYPTKDYALWPEHFQDTLDQDGSKLFILKPEDTESLLLLKELYPEGMLYLYDSGRLGKDFYIYEIQSEVSPIN